MKLLVLWGLSLTGGAAALRTANRGVAETPHDGNRPDFESGAASAGGSCRDVPLRPTHGAPPVWPCKERSRELAENMLMTHLDQWNSSTARGRDDPPLPGQSLGRLTGAQAFAFSHLVAGSVGVVREMERPVDNQVVLEASELDGEGFGTPATVVIDGGRFVMYYHRSRRGIIGRAESRDGLHWENRTKLNIHKIGDGSDFCVLLDKYEKDARFKWKMIANCRLVKDNTCFFSSADGLTWTPHNRGREIYGPFADTLACLHHDAPGKDYQLLVRYEKSNPKLAGRGIRGTVVLNGTLDGVLKKYGKVGGQFDANELSRTLFDSEFGDAEMFRRQLYSLSRTAFPDAGYMGIAQVYEYVCRSTDPRLDQRRAAELGLEEDYDSVFMYLMPSRDGLHFDRSWAYAGVRMLPDDLTDGYHFFSPAAELVTHQGYHWLYYDRNRERHLTRFQGKDALRNHIAVARFREGRLVRLRPVQENGVVVTQAFDFDPAQRLTLDALSWNSSSSLTVELLAAAGSSAGGADLLKEPAVARSAPILGANGSAPVTWLDDVKPFGGQPMRLRLGLSFAYLYGFQLG